MLLEKKKKRKINILKKIHFLIAKQITLDKNRYLPPCSKSNLINGKRNFILGLRLFIMWKMLISGRGHRWISPSWAGSSLASLVSRSNTSCHLCSCINCVMSRSATESGMSHCMSDGISKRNKQLSYIVRWETITCKWANCTRILCMGAFSEWYSVLYRILMSPYSACKESPCSADCFCLFPPVICGNLKISDM